MEANRDLFRPLVLIAFAAGCYPLHAQSMDPTAAPNGTWLVPSSKLNDDLPSWLRLSGEERARGEGDIGISFKNSNDRYLLNRLRLEMQIIPTDWLKFEFQSQDSRAFWREESDKPPYANTWDLRLAYMELGNLEKYHSTIRVGRQELAFGDERLLGNSNWTNVARSFDGYRTTLQDGKFRVDAFAASVVVLNNNGLGEHTPGNYIEGLYGEVANVIPNSTLQPYFLWRRSPGQKLGDGVLGTEDFGTTGVRWVGKLPAGFSYNTEDAIQRGTISTDRVEAWATHNEIDYQLPVSWTAHPKLMAEYNYASGDQNAKDKVHSTFDTLYASGHDKIEFADQVGWKNIEEVRTGPDFKVSRKLTASVRYSDLWLANAHDSLYNASGTAVVTRANGSAGRWVGQEFDGTLTYALSKSSQLGAGYGYLLPGTFLEKTTPGHSFTYPFLFYSTKF